jgi:deoxyribodipyrimidine photolyase-related protein
MKTLRLILGDQLNTNHSWFADPSPGVEYVLMETAEEASYTLHHIQKVAGFLAAMRRFAVHLTDRGHSVRYLALDDPANRQSFAENIHGIVEKDSFGRFEYMLPDEYRLDLELSRIAESLSIETAVSDTEHFLGEREAVKDFFAGKKRRLMESFYRSMRKRFDVLMDGGKPAGGKWNFDVKNRRPYDGKVPLPAPLGISNDVSDVTAAIAGAGVRTFGSIRPDDFAWPLDREQALNVLRRFVDERLPHFGTYQDSMTSESKELFHSRLSFALNTKMLSPIEVIRAAEDAWRADPDRYAVEQVEGFIRQILGWREYVRGIYWETMPGYSEENFFENTRRLPRFYWDADTRMECMKHAISQSLEDAYAHHIQRLMVTGNFALIAGIHPDDVDAWYLGIYIDAVEWVEMPNARGMSQFADGGIMATKPYAASANYINSMGDYCSGCEYDPKKRTGPGACPFNSLYWDFIDRNRSKLERNPRMGMMYRVWDRNTPETKREILDQAAAYLKDIEAL